MNGAVFHTSAKISTAIAQPFCPSQTVSAPGRCSAEKTVLTRPRLGSKIVFQVIAVTTVSTAHGTRMIVRSAARPLNAWCMAIAIAIPSASSSATETPVKTNVFFTASQNSLDCSACE